MTDEEKHIFLKEGTAVVGATHTEQDFDLSFYDDSIGGNPLWLIAEECGAWIVPRMLVCAKSFEEAYYLAIDNLPAIDEEEMKEACEATEEDESFELASGYSFQDNATGTGIVHSGGLHVRPLTRAAMDTHSIKIQIRTWKG